MEDIDFKSCKITDSPTEPLCASTARSQRKMDFVDVNEKEKTPSIAHSDATIRDAADLSEILPEDLSAAASIQRNDSRKDETSIASVPSATNVASVASVKSTPSIKSAASVESNSNERSIADDERTIAEDGSVHSEIGSQRSVAPDAASVKSSRKAVPEPEPLVIQGSVEMSMEFDTRESVFTVIIKKCKDVAAANPLTKTSDCFVEVHLLPDKTKAGMRRSATQKGTLSPVFDERLRFPIHESDLETRSVCLTLWHYGGFFKPDIFLGEVIEPLCCRMLKEIPIHSYDWRDMKPQLNRYPNILYKGELDLSIKYSPASTQKTIMDMSQVCCRGEVRLWIKQARNLMSNRSNGTCTPFVKVVFLPDRTKYGKQRTSVASRSSCPRWNSLLKLLESDEATQDIRSRGLEITVWDHDFFGRHQLLGGVRLNLGESFEHDADCDDWMDATGTEQHLWHAMTLMQDTWIDATLMLRPTMD